MTRCAVAAWATSSTASGGTVVTAPESTHGPPRGLLVTASSSQLRECFGLLVPLQPLTWTAGGLVCAPWLDPERAATALARCPLPIRPIDIPPVIPDSRAALVAGWYRRSDRHAPAPPRVRELVQCAGDGFGPADHPTTAMALAAIETLPSMSAVDVGCGSGLLAQAWAASGRGAAHGLDADPAAVRQARRSAASAGVADATFEVGRIERLAASELGRCAVLANLPPIAHHALMRRLNAAPAAAVLGGIRHGDDAALLAHYRALGMRRVRSLRTRRYVCHVLVAE